MPAVRHLTTSSWPVYNGGSRGKNFAQGEGREVSDDLAEYLINTFPGCFEIVTKKTKSAAVGKPTKAAVAKAPRKRRAPAKKDKS